MLTTMRAFFKRYQSESRLLILFIVVFALMAIISPNKFLNGSNLKNIAFQMPEFCLFSLAMMVVIVTGGINLSITSTAAMSQIAIALVMTKMYEAGINVTLAICAGLIAGLIVAVLCGLFNGILVAYLRVTPMMATLGTMMLFEGIALRITNGSSVTGFPEAYEFFGAKDLAGIPIPIIILLVTVIIVYFMLERTVWGEYAYTCGCNYKATEYSGVNVKRTLLKAYVLSAVLCMLAAVIMTSRYNSAKVDYGSSYLMLSIAAVLLGGTDINGGYGKIIGTVLAVAIIQIISNGLNVFGANRYFVNVVTGGILILVLTANYLSQVFKNRNFLNREIKNK